MQERMLSSQGKTGKDHWSHWLCVEESGECTEKQFKEAWTKEMYSPEPAAKKHGEL